jgi:hypothetical protein
MNRIIKTIIYILFINYSIASDFNTTNTSLKWEEVSTELYNDEKLKCSDGSDYKFYFKKGSENLLIFFSGGGACWDYDTCNSHNKSYPIKTYENKTDLKYNKPGHWKGLLDLDNSNNPIKDWSILFLPYCSADLHIGNKIKYYSKENRKIKIYHNGYNNINFALNWMKKNKIDSFNKTIVSGSSSGGYGAMFNFSLIKKKINSKSFIVVSDAADGVISKDFTENVFIKSSTPWNATISLEKTTNKNNSIIDYFDHIIKQNKDTKFLLVVFSNEIVAFHGVQLLIKTFSVKSFDITPSAASLTTIKLLELIFFLIRLKLNMAPYPPELEPETIVLLKLSILFFFIQFSAKLILLYPL